MHGIVDTIRNHPMRKIETVTKAARWQRNFGVIVMLITSCSVGAVTAQAAYVDDIGFTALAAELGADTPDGAGVPVSLIEAAVQSGEDLAWMPNTTDSEFSGKTITDITGAVPGVYSGHATSVGKRFFGNATSTSPGILAIDAWLADHWIGAGFLRIDTGGWPVYQPLASPARISNHSWIGSAGAYDGDALARLDWAIETDEMLQVVGFTGSSTKPLLSSAFNVIAVNRTDAPTNSGSADAGGAYTAGRTRPDIVAPEGSTSTATPRVASAAALLVEVGHGDPTLSTDPAGLSTTNRSGDTIYNAERVEVIKAALMAGADRQTTNSTSGDITDYRDAVIDQTANGLDRRYGAGQLNIQRSYHVIAAGEQNSLEDDGGSFGLVGATGFDYDPKFGGSAGSNTSATYYFAQPTGAARLTAALVWNIEIDGGTSNNFDGTATLYDLDLQLFDVTDPGNWISIGSSNSTTDNTENLWQLLEAGKTYAVRVERGASQGAFKWDYGLAWQVTPVATLAVDPISLPDGIWNQPYGPHALTASNGQAPYTWTVISGALSPGITLSPDGIISGTPTTSLPADFSVQVTDAAANTATLDLQFNVQVQGYVCGACHTETGF